MNIIDELEWRGAINQTTDKEALQKLTEEKNIGLYCGTDPTGDSLHYYNVDLVWNREN